MWPSLTNSFPGWQWPLWLALAAVPPLVVLLYFLKLRRRPLEVPSTYLWHKSIEDLHVNSIWQRLKRNLLLFLQLLLLLLVFLALLRPNWRTTRAIGDRSIFMIDASASMQAADVEPSRLEEAKRRVADMIDQMNAGDAAMIISFADTARVEQPFTRDRRLLRSALARIEATNRPTDMREALRVASGLANPGRASDAENALDFQVAEPMPAKLYVLSDGRFPRVTGFSLGNLRPEFIPVGTPEARNVAIAAFSVRRKESQPGQLEAFARLENFGPEDVEVSLELLLEGEMINADRLEVPAGSSRGVAYPIGTADSGVLTLKVAAGDDLMLDDEAWVAIQPPRHLSVLVVTTGNEPLEMAIGTRAIAERADVRIEPPGFLKTKEYQGLADTAALDLAIYDRCRPERPPHCNTLFIASLPPVEGWKAQPKVNLPQIIDTDAAHPLMQWLNLGDVTVLEATPLEVPPGGSVLMDSGAGPLLAVAPREQFEDAVLAFPLVEEVAADGKSEKFVGTNWQGRASFPVFMMNVLDYLGGGRTSMAGEPLRPGRPITLESPDPRASVAVRTPSKKSVPLEGGKLGRYSFAGTEELGVYDFLSGGKPVRSFAVNLFDPAESDIGLRLEPDAEDGGRMKPAIQIGHVEVAGERDWEPARRETWKYLLSAGLAVLLLEWYIYNRRVAM